MAALRKIWCSIWGHRWGAWLERDWSRPEVVLTSRYDRAWYYLRQCLRCRALQHGCSANGRDVEALNFDHEL